MKLTTRNKGGGRYSVLIDGRETTLFVERGEPPAYRMPQEWSIGVVFPDGDRWLSYDQKGRQQALDTIEAILLAAVIPATSGKNNSAGSSE